MIVDRGHRQHVITADFGDWIIPYSSFYESSNETAYRTKVSPSRIVVKSSSHMFFNKVSISTQQQFLTLPHEVR